MSYLQIKNLTRKLNEFTLHVKSLDIEKGMFFGVLGNSGTGKSTLLNLICGLESHESGQVILDSKDISSTPANRRDMAYVFQDALLFEGLSVRENLEYILKAKKEKISFELISSILKECEALSLENRDIKSLSGGQKQRVALAMALMLKPKVLLLDEPFSNLDTTLKIKMRTFLKKLINKHHITTLMVTHDKDDAFLLFDKMMLLEDGKVIQVGSPKQMYEKPNSLITAKYFGIENIFSGCIKKEMFQSKNLSLHVAQKDCKECSFIVPSFAIRVCEKNGTQYHVSNVVYIEGRWQIELENSLVFYVDEKPKDKVSIKIDIDKCTIERAEVC